MLQSIKQLYGKYLGTSDGEIGHIRDFYFDDQHWAIRYVVVDTGSWLAERLVLLSPHAFGSLYQEGDSLLVSLTRKQIENSPSIALHKPISRQFEEEYYRYYGWPSYWEGSGMWGLAGSPNVPPPLPALNEQASEANPPRNDGNPHLRSTKAVTGYHIQTHEGAIGHVTDFIMDDKSWALRHLVVETGHWYAGKEIAISPKQIDRISYEESKVFVNVTKQAIQSAAEYEMPVAAYHDARNFDD